MKKPPKKWGKGYAMVPGWLLRKEPTPNAVVVYVHLAMHGTFNTGEGLYESCKPSKRTLANGSAERGYPGCGLSEQVIGRALRELEGLSAIKGEPAWDEKTGAQLPNVYRLIFGELEEEEETAAQDGVSPVTPPVQATTSEDPEVPGEGMRSDTPRGDQIDTPGEVSPVIHNQEPLTQNPLPRSDSVAVSGGENNPPRSDVDSLPREVEAESGGDSESISETEKNLLTAAVEQAHGLRFDAKGWSRDAIVEAMRAQLDAGYAVPRVAAVIVEAARDTGGTQYPGRIGYLLSVATRPISAPPAGTAQGAAAELGRKYLAPGTEMCRKHRSEPAGACGACRADAIAEKLNEPAPKVRPEESDELPEDERLTGAALARKIAAESATRSVPRFRAPWVPKQAADRPTGLDKLRAATELGDQADAVAVAS